MLQQLLLTGSTVGDDGWGASGGKIACLCLSCVRLCAHSVRRARGWLLARRVTQRLRYRRRGRQRVCVR